jgi:hypothetical protein
MGPDSLNLPVPPVDPADVQAVWRFMCSMRPGLGDSTGDVQGAEYCASNVSIGIDLIAQNCSEGADAYAVFFRTSLLGVLLRMGLLSPWEHDGELAATVFEAAAKVPIASLEGFDPGALLEMLGGNGDLQ